MCKRTTSSNLYEEQVFCRQANDLIWCDVNIFNLTIHIRWFKASVTEEE